MDIRPANRVLGRLYDAAGGFVGVDALAGAEALALALEELAGRGHRFERSPEGVRLVRPTVLDAYLIERGLPVERIGKHVICFGEVGSTMDVAFDSASGLGPEGGGGEAVVVTAESQSAGRGRFGRKWLSPRGSGILASVLLEASAWRLSHDALTIAAGLAVAEGIEDASGVAAVLDWPNDVVLGGAKLAGVLVEVRGRGAARRTVIGMGINVSAAPAGGQIGRPAACLADAAAGPVERIEVLRAVLCRLDRRVAGVGAGEIAELHDGWCRRSGMLLRRITAVSGGRRYTGRVVDVSPLEGLVVQTDAGEHIGLPAGRTTVLG